ncbi:MAG: DUF2231 domain-containing protein [Planctomycetota bacterium]|nr:MAG: DUF2231 domain-containing protein [Planctomycetota bacterium]
MQNLHPVFVHFPIALLTFSVIFDAIGMWLKKESLKNAAWWTMVAGIGGILLAVATGLWAESTVPHGGGSHEIMEIHETLELIGLGAFVVLFIWRSVRKSILPEVSWQLGVYFFLAAVGLATMLYGAHLGGRLVYEFGVGGQLVNTSQQNGHSHEHGESGHSH